ncbi:MAG TPA: DNA translocase FtsK 4TM domain-containing protein [Bryobacteraceae bacterium]|nr:DNA translocase FtsK 4TM domain-containing protein [Bryobacteraceae bacterium]
MKFLSPTESKRLNEVLGFVFLAFGLLVLFSLISYRTYDPSWNTATSSAHAPQNLAGYVGSYLSDLLLQTFGLAALLIPAGVFVLGWKWIRSDTIVDPGVKLAGFLMLGSSLCAVLGEGPEFHVFGLPASGLVGMLLAHALVAALNRAGAVLVTLTVMVVSVYLVSTFTLSMLQGWLAAPMAWLQVPLAGIREWLEERRKRRIERRRERARLRAEERAAARAARRQPVEAMVSDPEPLPMVIEPGEQMPAQPALDFAPEDIPICPLEEPAASAVTKRSGPRAVPEPRHVSTNFRLPTTALLNESPGRTAYDEQELKDIAARVKSKFEEFNVLGSVVQINPGPVVTTFEFKPEAGIKYTRITTLNEDLCMALQAESILIERIPGKPTVGIEVPNTRRELISLREVFESEEFAGSHSHLTISLGKDINGRIKVSALDSMPHLLIAGSTGSGKSVMINSLIMSVLYKSTPDDVRMILVDPKRLEMGLYEGIPHLLTPVITDPRKATNALRNAVLEMERRLRVLAEQGVRNIDQYNKKIRKLQQEVPRDLFEEAADEPQPLPYILILIDELADLMMIEGRNVEESVTRLAQMARAVGMHLVLATQRPSVDVITGLIKANFPARISFRVATRVDSRTILDVMGAEHLLGKGDMLFLPPGSSRLTRVHGAFVTENEINRVVDFWKEQAAPEYDQSLLLAPPAEEGEISDEEGDGLGEQDPMYEEALRVVLEMGKASTSTLQRRLRLGYGRAARILDMMHRDGIIGPPDGSKPREVLKRPEWLREVEGQVR